MTARPILLATLLSLVLGGCLSKVPPEERRHDSWRNTSEMLSRPTTLD